MIITEYGVQSDYKAGEFSLQLLNRIQLARSILLLLPHACRHELRASEKEPGQHASIMYYLV